MEVLLFKINEMNDHSKGQLKAIFKMIHWAEKQIVTIKRSETQPNTPRQIANGGKLKAYNNLLTKLRASQKKIESLCEK